MQAVGQLDEDHADVVDHGQEHLAHVLRLALLARGEIDLADLGDALDDVRHLLAEFLLDLLDGDRGVFHRVVQQAGGDGDRVQLHVRQHVCDFQGVREVGLARGALLALVVAQGKIVGLADQLQIVARTVLPHLLQQVTEAGDRQNIRRDLVA